MLFPHSLICVFSSFCTPLSSLGRISSLQPLQEEEKASKKPGRGRPLLGREKSADSLSSSSSASAEKQRQEARKRLLAAKKAASFRQNSATESADSIEIYVPEAQTRLWDRGALDQRTDKCQWNTWGTKFCNANELLWVNTEGGNGGGGIRMVLGISATLTGWSLDEEKMENHIFTVCAWQTMKQEDPDLKLPLKTSADELWHFSFPFFVS